MQLLFIILLTLLVAWDAIILMLFLSSFLFKNRLEKAGRLPEILVLIPAHNEEQVIETTLSTLKEAPARVVVVADHCNDRTPEIARRLGFETFIFNQGNSSTKAKALAAALDFYKTESWDYLMIMDADNILSGNFWIVLPEVLASNPQVLQVEARPANPKSSLTTKMITVLYGFLNRVIQRGRAVLGLNANLCGTGMLFKRDVLLSKVPWDKNMGLVEDIFYQIRLYEKDIPICWADSIWVVDEKPRGLKYSIVQGSRWLRGRIETITKCAKLFPRRPALACSAIWTILPKPVFWIAFLLANLNGITSFLPWKFIIPLLMFPWIAWVLPSFIFTPYQVGSIALLFPLWQMGVQILHLGQAIWDRGKGWRHTRHFGHD